MGTERALLQNKNSTGKQHSASSNSTAQLPSPVQHYQHLEYWSTNLTASFNASTSSVLQELKSLGFPPRSMWKFFLLCTPSTDTTLHRQDSFKFNIARTHVQGLGGTPSMGFLVESVVQGLVVVEVKDTSRVEDFDASSGCGVLSPASVTGSCSFAPSMYKYSAM